MYSHENLLGIQRASNPSTGDQRMSIPAHPLMAQIEKIFSELKVQIKEKWKPGLKPASKKLLGALNDIVMFIQNSFDVYYI